ncbi:MAG: hypothetical protein ACKVT2_18870 [Saprospiraceae bacterium]
MDTSQAFDPKIKLQELLRANKIEETLELLRQIIAPTASDKINLHILLSADLSALKALRMGGVEDLDTLIRKEKKLRNSVLEFINILSEVDLDLSAARPAPTDAHSYAPAAAPAKKSKTGSVLYAIPHTMQVNTEKKCVVRLAFDEKYLLENFFQGSGTHIQSIRRIEERMEVELLDPNEEKVFVVREINSTMQKVEQEDYTEWLFFVKPLLEGTFELWIKVTVVIKSEDGSPDRKEIVLQENIEVVTHATTADAGMELRHTGFIFSIGGGGGLGTSSDSGGNQAPPPPPPGGSAPGFWSSVAGKATAAVSALAIAGGLWYASTRDSDNSLSGGAIGDSKLAQLVSNEIKPPFKEIDVPMQTFVINPSRDTTIKLPSGTTLTFSANSIVNSEQHFVTDMIEIRVREFKKSHEIIASGIPMRFLDGENKAQWMQTAGMFEVQGWCGGKQVALAAGKTIKVNLISEVSGSYDFWVFNQRTGNWENKGSTPDAVRVNVPPSPAIQKEINDLKRETKQLKQFIGNQSGKPRTYNGYSYKKGEINVDCCPELLREPVVVLTYAGDDPAKSLDQNTWVASDKWKGTWTQKKITRLSGNHYRFEWRGDTVFRTEVKRPGQDDFAKAQARHDSLSKVYEQRMAMLQEKEAIISGQAQFRRSMEVQGFGIYNYDILWKKEDAVQLTADFDFGPEYDLVKDQVIVYLVTGDGRTVAALPYRDWSKFSFSPSSDNKMLAVLPGNKIAVFTQKDFKRDLAELLNAKGQKHTFKMRVQDQAADSLNDLHIILQGADEVL